MAGRIPPFTLDDFKLSPAKRAEITEGLTERQAFGQALGDLGALGGREFEIV